MALLIQQDVVLAQRDASIAQLEEIIRLQKMQRFAAKIESKIDHLSAEEKYTVRQELALPVLQDLKTWLDTNQSKVPKGPQRLTDTP